MTNVLVQTLIADAALTGDPEHIVHAMALDPLTGAVCTLKQIRDMASEMLEAQREWLPEFGNRKIRPTPTVSIPKDVKVVDVPLDPALAIHKRFGQLITQKTD
jgi:alpha-galactosidase